MREDKGGKGEDREKGEQEWWGREMKRKNGRK